MPPTSNAPFPTDPSADLAAVVVGHLLEAGLIREEDGAKVAEALATGRVSPDDWVRWVQDGCSPREAPDA